MKRLGVGAWAVVLIASAVSAQPKTANASTVALWARGTFVHTTRLFRATGDQWSVTWSYNCHPYGSKDNFSIWVYGREGNPVDLVANEVGWSGHATTYMHQSGVFYLEISGCAWNVVAHAGKGSGMLRLPTQRTVLTASGTGTKETRLFNVPNEWEIHWSYNCHPTGFKGNVTIWVADKHGQDRTLAVNEVAWSDYGTEYMHQGGTVYLDVSGECPWQMRVTK